MYRTSKKVPLPPKDKRVILNGVYVYYFTERHYDPKLKRTLDNRIPVGKVCPDNQDMMYPNTRWEEVMERAHEEQAGKTAKHINAGVYLCLYEAAERIGCLSALKEAFPDLWEKILALCVYIIDAHSCVGQQFPYWGFHNYAGLSAPFSDSTISEVFRAIAEDDWAMDRFMEEFGKNYTQAVPQCEYTAVALDSTNRNTTCKDNKYAEYGKQKVKKSGVPQVNTALIVDETTAVPLYYENFFGSILDKTQTPVTMEKIRELGFCKLIVAMDSGYASRQCMAAFHDGYEFSVMTPKSYSIVDELIDAYGREIVSNEKYYLHGEDVYGICKKGVDVFPFPCNAYLFYDAKRAQKEVCSIHEKVEALVRTALDRKRYSEKLKKQYAPYIIIDECPRDRQTGRNFTAVINSEAVQKEVDKAGFFVVLSNSDSTTDRIIRITRMRDRNEKAFARFKSHFDMMASDTHTTATYEGKTFIGFVSLIICEAYRWYIRDILRGKSSTTIETTLSELRKYQMMQKKDGSYMPVYAMSKKQKELFSCFGIDQYSIRDTLHSLPHRTNS